MSNTIKKKQSGSPAPHQSRVAGGKTRPKRVPVGGDRDILTVLGKDPDYVYRWVKDTNENGGRIFRYTQALYAFVDRATAAQYGIGESFVYESQDVGTLVRKPAGNGEYLYLMRIAKEYYDEDQDAKQARIQETENGITRSRDPESNKDDGQYGSVKIS